MREISKKFIHIEIFHAVISLNVTYFDEHCSALPKVVFALNGWFPNVRNDTFLARAIYAR